MTHTSTHSLNHVSSLSKFLSTCTSITTIKIHLHFNAKETVTYFMHCFINYTQTCLWNQWDYFSYTRSPFHNKTDITMNAFKGITTSLNNFYLTW